MIDDSDFGNRISENEAVVKTKSYFRKWSYCENKDEAIVKSYCQ